MSIEPKEDFQQIAASHEVAAVLQRARDILAQGWCQHVASKTVKPWFGREWELSCATNAIGIAVGEDDDLAYRACVALCKTVMPGVHAECPSMTVHLLQMWNDSRRDKAIVLHAFDEAIRQAGRV